MNGFHSSILAVALVGSCVLTRQSLAMEPSELVLGGIAIGDSEASVLQKLGEPDSRDDVIVGDSWTYDGLELLLDAQGVLEITSTSSEICTPSDVCPGIDLVAVEQIYKTPLLVERSERNAYEYYVDGESCWLQLFTQDDVADELKIVCQP